MYYVKVMGGVNDLSSGNSSQYGEHIGADVQTITTNVTTNTNTINTNSNENDVLGNLNINNSANIYQTNQSNTRYRYYYNELNEYSKIIYDAIANNIDKLKSGTEKIYIDYDFTKVWNNGNGKQELKQYYDDAVNAINLDYPDLFYIDFSRMWLTIKNVSTLFSNKCELYIDPGEHTSYYIDGFTSKEQVEKAVNQVENVKAQVKSTLVGSDYYKMKKLHDWMIDYMEYEASSTQKATVYGALIEKKGVCESYARTYKTILDELGIQSILVTGTATNSNGITEDHMWNYVKLDNVWYAVDVTWDDPLVIGGGTVSDEVRHKYFLSGSKEFFKNHTEKLNISNSGKVFNLPKLSIDKF